MEMYTNIVGIVPANEKYKKMVQAYQSCVTAGIKVPVELLEYFSFEDEEETPSNDGIEIKIENAITKEGEEEYEEGAVYNIDLSLIPENVKKIRIKVGYC